LALACSSSDDGTKGSTDEDLDNGPPVTSNNPPAVDSNPGGGDDDGEADPLPDPDANNDEDDAVNVNDVFVESLLQKACGQCHGEAAEEDGNCRAGMCYIENVNELIENGKIVPGSPETSPLYQRITRTDSGVMPPPGQEPRLSTQEISQVRDFILRKDPIGPAQVCSDQFLSWDDVYETIEADLLRQDAEDRVFIRYLTLTDRYNAGVCDQQLEDDRFAMNKFINSISQENSIREAVEVQDPEGSKTIFRIDLRDYALDDSNGPFVVNNESFVDGWEAIIGNNNFAVQFQGDQAENVQLLSGTTVPLMFSDAVIDEASFGNLYYGLLRLSDTRDQVQADLGVDLDGDLDQKITIRAGTTNSEISQQERLMQRNEQDIQGYYYESFDLDPQVAGDSIFDNPLEFDQNANGSEAVFSLPNGLQAYIIFDENGNRLEESPILFDNVTQNDNVMRAGVSCSNCHYDGLIKFDDQVREFVLDNRIEAAEAAAAVGQEFEDILDLYPEKADLDDQFDRDSSLYQRALTDAGVPTNLGEDPIAKAFVRFDRDADINVIAGLVGFPADALQNEVNRLDPQLGGLDNGFKIDIDDFKALYANTLCVVSVANENRPLDQVCIDAGVLQ
jgi:hypothetical protein